MELKKIKILISFFLALSLCIQIVFAADQSIGIYSGTFDPIHNGHLKEVADLSVKHFKLDKIIIYPNLKATGKQPTLSFKQRWELVYVATKDNPLYILPPIETLNELLSEEFPNEAIVAWAQKNHPINTKFYQLMGTDSFEKFKNYPNGKKFLKNKKNEIDIIVISRKGYYEDTKKIKHHNIHWFTPKSNMEMSSSSFRKDPVKYELNLPEAVVKEIKKQGYYGWNSDKKIYDLPDAASKKLTQINIKSDLGICLESALQN